MDKSEVMGIIVENLSQYDDTNCAFIMTYLEVGNRIFDQLVDDTIEDEFKDKLRFVHRVRSSYLGFKALKELGGANSGKIQYFVAFHGQLCDIVAFLCHDYDRLNFEKVKEIFPKTKLEESLAVVRQNQEKLVSQMVASQLTEVRTRIEAAEELFDLAYFVILGEAKYHQFLVEFNKVLGFLKEFQKDLVPID